MGGMKVAALVAALVFVLANDDVVHAQPETVPIGRCLRRYSLPDENTEVRGLAIDDSEAESPRLYTLDQAGKIFAYRFGGDAEQASADLELLETVDLSAVVKPARLTGLRGLTTAVENGQRVFYFLNWDRSRGSQVSQLWRFGVADATASSVDLSLYMFRVGDRELFDVKCDGGQILVGFDPTGYLDQNLRVQRGIIRIQWRGAFGEGPQQVGHLPDSGTSPARGLARMELNGTAYLWATVGNDHIYCADAATGRGLFFFDLPKSEDQGASCWGIDYGCGDLWVAENTPGTDHVYRVNVTKNPDAFFEGPRILRHLTMTIQTEPESDAASPGMAYHYYSRPYGYEQLHNQGCWPETETLVDVSQTPKATIQSITYDPARDAASRQHMWCVQYADAPQRGECSSRYEIDIWTNPYKKFVYPHRVDTNRESLENTDYLADDCELYNLSDTATYAAFVERVKSHIGAKSLLGRPQRGGIHSRQLLLSQSVQAEAGDRRLRSKTLRCQSGQSEDRIV